MALAALLFTHRWAKIWICAFPKGKVNKVVSTKICTLFTDTIFCTDSHCHAISPTPKYSKVMWVGVIMTSNMIIQMLCIYFNI